jgi:hypothetical protein
MMTFTLRSTDHDIPVDDRGLLLLIVQWLRIPFGRSQASNRGKGLLRADCRCQTGGGGLLWANGRTVAVADCSMAALRLSFHWFLCVHTTMVALSLLLIVRWLLFVFHFTDFFVCILHFADLGPYFAPFGWSHFGLNALVALIWIPWMSSAIATELLVTSTACACGALPVSLFWYPK